MRENSVFNIQKEEERCTHSREKHKIIINLELSKGPKMKSSSSTVSMMRTAIPSILNTYSLVMIEAIPTP